MGSGRDIDDMDLEWSPTSHFCSTCGGSIDLKEEVFVITIVLVQGAEGGVTYAPLLFSDSDFLYEPHFICYACWDDNREQLKNHRRDTPPIEDEYSVIECGVCKSGIRSGEVTALASIGEIVLSNRSPNGVRAGTTFNCTDETEPLCISCINVLSRDIVDELWREPVRQYHECTEGTEIRCWRSGCPADETNDCANCKR